MLIPIFVPMCTKNQEHVADKLRCHRHLMALSPKSDGSILNLQLLLKPYPYSCSSSNPNLCASHLHSFPVIGRLKAFLAQIQNLPNMWYNVYVCKDIYIYSSIYYIILYYIILHYIILYHIILYYIIYIYILYILYILYIHIVLYYYSINTQPSVVPRLDKWTIVGWMSISCQGLIPFHPLHPVYHPPSRSMRSRFSLTISGEKNHCPMAFLRHPLCSDAPKYHILLTKMHKISPWCTQISHFGP